MFLNSLWETKILGNESKNGFLLARSIVVILMTVDLSMSIYYYTERGRER